MTATYSTVLKGIHKGASVKFMGSLLLQWYTCWGCCAAAGALAKDEKHLEKVGSDRFHSLSGGVCQTPPLRE